MYQKHVIEGFTYPNFNSYVVLWKATFYERKTQLAEGTYMGAVFMLPTDVLGKWHNVSFPTGASLAASFT